MATQAMIKGRVSVEPGSSRVSKVAFANLVVFLAVIAVLNLITGTPAFATCFAFGFLLGAGNIYWLLRISRKAVSMKMEKAIGYAALNYYARFILVILTFTAVVIFDILNPWQLLAGFIASTMTTITMLVLLGREGAKDAS